MYKKFFKRFIDIALSIAGIIVLAIPMLIVAIIIKIDSKGPVLFKQVRVGKDKKPFTILKFRSMAQDTPKNVPTHMLGSATSYITKFGAFMRKTSIDEFPQLFCILKGDMTIIGPRPCLFNQEDLMEEREKYAANNLKPGLTGWAQVNGRDELSIDVKARFDGEYVEKMSFLFDVKCFCLTFIRVLQKDGVQEGKKEEKEEVSV
ncbi:MAG: sugar transferase [Clostridia bacterium]